MKSTALRIPRAKNQIRAWLYSRDSATGLEPVVIICHGIPGGRPGPDDRGYLPLAGEIVSAGFQVVLFNFSGCGESPGDIDMQTWYADLLAVYDSVRELPGVDPASLHAIGFSAGGAIASKAACLDNCFQSLLLMAAPADFSAIIPEDTTLLAGHFRQLGVIQSPGFPVDAQAWRQGFLDLKPGSWLPLLAPRPLCIVHGDQDGTVPVAHAHLLYAAARQPKEIKILPGAMHQLRRDARTGALILAWLKEVACV